MFRARGTFPVLQSWCFVVGRGGPLGNGGGGFDEGNEKSVCEDGFVAAMVVRCGADRACEQEIGRSAVFACANNAGPEHVVHETVT